MEHLKNAWNNFKAQPEIWFFYGFLLTSMLSIRKVLFDYPLAGAFNEYTGGYFYLSDLFLLAALAAWLVSILYNKNDRLSIYRNLSVSRGTLYALGIFLAWSLFTVGWAKWPEIGYFRFFKLFEMAGLLAFLILNPKCFAPAPLNSIVPRGTIENLMGWNILRNILRVVIFLGVANSLIGIGQFMLQHSVGLFWLRESLIGPDIAGVAKIIFSGHKYIRIYGLFPHPNILGGFLMLSILASLAYRKMFYPSQNVPSQSECSTWNIRRDRYGTSDGTDMEQDTSRPDDKFAQSGLAWPAWNSFYIRNGQWIWSLILGIQIAGEMLALSKSAILGLILALAYLYHRAGENVPFQAECSTSVRMFHTEHSTGQARNIRRDKRRTSLAADTQSASPVGSWWNGLWNKLSTKKGPKNRYFKFLGLFGIGLIVGFFVRFVANVSPADIASFFFKSLQERWALLIAAKNMIITHPLIGVGLGQFVPQMQDYLPNRLLDWQYQPVHNVFLLVWSEVGIIGLFGLLYILRTIWRGSEIMLFQKNCSMWNIHQSDRETSNKEILDMNLNVPWGTRSANFADHAKAILVGFTFIALFDHYFWDLQQGQIMLWLVLGLLVGVSRKS